LLKAIQELADAGAYSSVENPLQCHDLLAKAALGRLCIPARRLLHGQIARSLVKTLSGADFPSRALDALMHFEMADLTSELSELVPNLARRYLERDMPSHAAAVLRRYGSMEGARPASLSDLLEEALYRAGDYEGLLDICRTASGGVRALRISNDLAPEKAIRRIDAASHSDTLSDTGQLAAHAVLISETPHYSADIRMTAALLALRIVANGLDTRLADRAYRAGVAACESDQVKEAQRLQFDFIFHTSFGELDSAKISATGLLALLPQMPSGGSRVTLKQHTAYALRICGSVEQSRALFEEVHEESKALEMRTAAVLSAWYISLIADEAHADETLAWQWLERAKTALSNSTDPLLALVVRQHTARLIIGSETRYDRNTAAALACTSAGDRYFPKREAYATAISLAFSLREGDQDQTERLLAHGMSLFSIVRGTLGQDYLATQLTRALLSLGRAPEAAALISTYLSRWRREKYPLPHYLHAAAQTTAMPQRESWDA
jgi:hypothetical protein